MKTETKISHRKQAGPLDSRHKVPLLALFTANLSINGD
jgi:hypothetical protein